MTMADYVEDPLMRITHIEKKKKPGGPGEPPPDEGLPTSAYWSNSTYISLVGLGVPNSGSGIFSIWYRLPIKTPYSPAVGPGVFFPTGFGGAFKGLVPGVSEVPNGMIRCGNSTGMHIKITNLEGQTFLQSTFNPGVWLNGDTGWHHVFFSWSLLEANFFVDGVNYRDNIKGEDRFEVGSFDFSEYIEFGMLGDPHPTTNESFQFTGMVVELYFAPGQYLPTPSAFVRTDEHGSRVPALIGSHGQIPTGLPPAIYAPHLITNHNFDPPQTKPWKLVNLGTLGPLAPPGGEPPVQPDYRLLDVISLGLASTPANKKTTLYLAVGNQVLHTGLIQPPYVPGDTSTAPSDSKSSLISPAPRLRPDRAPLLVESAVAGRR